MRYLFTRAKDRRVQPDDLALAAHLARLYPDLTAFRIQDTIARVARLSAEYAKIQEVECERELDQEDEKHGRKLERMIRRALAPLEGTTAVFSGDPRGHCVRLRLPLRDGRATTNSWDNETWGIR